MFQELKNRLHPDLFKRFSIFNYLYQADFSKTTIYWNQLSHDQEAVKWLSDPKNIDKVDYFVFVSFWQAENYRKNFGVPGFKTKVIQNACSGVKKRVPGSREKVRLCYTSTPWRGLDVLLDSWERLDPRDAELHIFSSCKIYGKEFSSSEDKKFEELYRRCKSISGVVYRGSIPNDQLRSELPDFDILAYPNTFEETSCISVIEALCAGLRVVTSDLGALPETTEGWASMYPFLADKSRHAAVFSSLLNEEIQNVKAGLDTTIQASIYSEKWSWDSRIYQWIKFLDTFTPKGY
jgi:glycosyltransferase involved in cell wall biosynthesis